MIKEIAYAKINIYLKVLGKRNDGYHNLESLMVPIDLFDELEFMDSSKDEIISNIDIKDNIMFKAINYLKEKYNIKKYVKIILNKNIPLSSGLAGGSADLSATLRGLNRLWNLNLSIDELGKISLLFGSDTLFCMYNKPAIIKGRGEVIEFVDYAPRNVLLFNPKIEVKTKDVFSNYKESDEGENELEMALLRLYPSIKDFKEYYEKQGLNLHLSGSGSTYFSFDKKEFKSNKNYIEIKTKTM
ncbi:MAG: 4-(cytidine 5'-diphospho)-2-C-methyl-D-erythritol kinase [Acholeplasmatales bacterium]|nr:4-(cytidine 5'-diphospho)-2-C-methyl-D-erythritol kinase [Acholeplasmatales bacterium]